MTTTEKLLPCPICGAKAQFEKPERHVWSVGCGQAGCIDRIGYFNDKKSAAEHWNTRADHPQLSAEDLAKVRNIVDRCKEYTYQIGGETNNQRCEKEVKRMCREQAEICNTAIAILDRAAKAVG